MEGEQQGVEAKEVFEGMKAPLDEDGYVQSFAVEDTEGQRAFFDTYGFVVVRDVLDSTEVDVPTPSSPSHLSSFMFYLFIFFSLFHRNRGERARAGDRRRDLDRH
jgi:hypothetical protein